MKLNQRIPLVTIGVLFVTLLISAVVTISNFQKDYTEAVVRGSEGLGQGLNSIIHEMLDLGLPLESLAGMDKKVKQVVEDNPHISYVGISDVGGRILFHSDSAMVGRTISDIVARNGRAATAPLMQSYWRFDGHEYYDIALPIFDTSKTRAGTIRIGFPVEVVNDKVQHAIIQVLINVVLSFLIIAFLTNLLLSRLVSKPVIALAEQARKIAEGQFFGPILAARNDEIGLLSGSLNAMATTIKSQIAELQNSREDLEQRVTARTSELASEQQRLSNILWGTGVGTWEWNVQTGEVRFNERWAEIVGYRLEELAPVNIDTWMRLAHPDDKAQSGALLTRHFSGESEYYECEARMRHKAGHWIWVLDRGRLLSRTPDGQPEWMAGTHWEITARKQVEEEILRSNAELEQFSYAISHDMRQPLRMISSYLHLLEQGISGKLDSEQREYFNFAIDGARRMDTMMLGLLEYSRVGRKGEPSVWLESRGLVDEALLFLQPAIREARAVVRIQGEWPRVRVSPDEMLRLIQNLIGNAVKFRVAGRTPEVSVTSEAVGNEWRVSITDNGVGILPDQIGRLFQVFQRLQSRADYEGTGIGLALCRKIVEHHNGRIWVESAGERQGSTFQFILPLSRSAD